MEQQDNEMAVNPLPPVIAALFLVIIGIEVTFFLGNHGMIGGPQAVGWRLAAVQKYAFSGEILDWMIATGRWPAEHMIRFLSYPFVHGGFGHALIAGVILLAMGKMVGDLFGSLATLVIFLASAVGGALAYGLILDDPLPLLGAFPAVYGLIGAYTFILWVSLGSIGANQVNAFRLIALLMAIQLVFGLLFDTSNDWLADLAGFGTGFLLSFVVSPGGWARVRARIRRG
ncbi:rhomboid family intramembrane serine protease [Pukyongiella litopenaei]|uniref:Rhomboid family intramembrane serine protease n=1 Tax=Pukyongiella litopenaei TaxID=2605946 RepID=A0A2S0MQS4_9RHOB|nr:rhomboid family intramembrane serine protease [Pukyongiella litopenaei]AVO38053.1 rhomboid family intramembrane serine protease [Pukyongiella litopenaei]